MKDSPYRIAVQWTLIAVFSAAVCVPGFMACFSREARTVDEAEKRRLAVAPDPTLSHAGLKKLPGQIDAYLNDHIGFRSSFILVHQYYQWQSGISSHAQVVNGRDNWFYFNLQGEMDDFLGKRPVEEPRLAKWEAELRKRSQWFEKAGIKYIFFIAPDKHTIHPEHLPQAYLDQRTPRTFYDALASRLDHHDEINFLNLRDPLRQAARRRDVYLPHDTHWNDIGRRVAYRELLQYARRWYTELQPLSDADFIEETSAYKGDLLALVGASFITGEAPFLRLRSVSSQPGIAELSSSNTFPRERLPELWMRAHHNPNRKRKLLLYGDSFLANPAPLMDLWFAEHFGRVFIMRNISPVEDFTELQQLVEQERPDLVIECRVERFLHTWP